MRLSRRTVIVGAGAAAIAPALPDLAAVAQPVAPTLPLVPAWEVGIEDWMGWRVIHAATAERAMQIFREDIGLCDGCDGLRCAELDPDGECEHSGLDARRASSKVIPDDVEGEHSLTNEEMNRLGWSHHCDRHNDVCEEWNIVGKEIVCDDCMELADWEIANPKYAATLRAEKEEEFWNEMAETLPSFFAITLPTPEQAE